MLIFICFVNNTSHTYTHKDTIQVQSEYLLIILPVVWNASSTMPSSWSEAAKWNTLKIFFQPDLILAACELTIWAIQRTTISRIVGDLQKQKKKITIINNRPSANIARIITHSRIYKIFQQFNCPCRKKRKDQNLSESHICQLPFDS